MAIFLAMPQRKILQSPDPIAPFVLFYQVLNLLTLYLKKKTNITLQ